MDNGKNEHVEIEARFLDLDEEEIKKRLNNIDAEKISDSFFREWIFDKPEWRDDRRRVRVRTDGDTTWLTYKANETWEVDSTKEVELTVSSPEAAVKFVESCDVPIVRYQEKKRIQYKKDDIVYELDFWPKIPMVLEIEADTKEMVKKGAEMIGLSWNDAVFEDQLMVHHMYGVDLTKDKNYKFEE